jgi:hypothetical protein
MKIYNKPNTQVQKIELVQMIASTNLMRGDDINTGEGDAREGEVTSGSVWDEEE